MLFRKKQNFFKSFFLNQFFLTILGLLVIFLISFPLAKKVSKQYKVNKEIEELKMEIAEVEGKNSDLKNLLSYLDSDQFIEEQAREKLNYKNEGEEVVVIKKQGEIEEPQTIVSTESENIYNIKSSDSNAEMKNELNYKKWIKYFFKQ